MTNPQYLQGKLGSVVNAYQLQNWTPLAPGAHQFAAANWQVSQTVQDQMLTSRNNARRALAEVAARASELAQKSQLQQQQQLAAGREVQHQQMTEMTGVSFGQDVNSSINMLQSLSNGYGAIARWNQ